MGGNFDSQLLIPHSRFVVPSHVSIRLLVAHSPFQGLICATLESLDLASSDVLRPSLELAKRVEGFVLGLEQINGVEVAGVVVKAHKVAETARSGNRHVDEICMDKIE